MTLGDRVAVMRDGILQQVDTPQNLYRHPANLFVAAFIGSPPMNLVEATVTGDRVAFAGFDIPIQPGALSAFEGSTVILDEPRHRGRRCGTARTCPRST